MRIGILTSVHPTLDTRIYFKQARSLAGAGHQVYLVARRGADAIGVEHVPLKIPRSRWERAAVDLQVLRHAVRLRCDAYHVHDPELLPIGVVAKAMTGAALVYDVHENVRSQIRNKYWIPKCLRGSVAWAYDVAERACMRWVDHLILAEDSYASDYRTDRRSVVRNYPIIAGETASAEHRSYSSQPVLAYCGVVAEIRGAFEMLESLAILRQRFPDAQLQVVGPFFPESLGERLRHRMDELGLSEHVRMHGRLPLDAALREVARCDIGLALLHPDPNYLESLPTKMFEYMSLRLPVVVSNFPLWRQIVEKGGCGVAVDPLDPARVASAIAGIAADPERIRVLGANGRRAVVERYSWAAEERKLLDIYAGFESEPSSCRIDPSLVAGSEPGQSAVNPPSKPRQSEQLVSSGGAHR